MVIANAVYFNAAWEEPFLPSGTHKSTFHKADGTDVEINFMNTDRQMLYAK